MTYFIVLLAIPAIAIWVGYAQGRDHHDPHTKEGRAYYARRGK